MPRTGGRPNRDRVMMSFYISRTGKTVIDDLAEARGQTRADTIRALLTYASVNMPPKWRPPS